MRFGDYLTDKKLKVSDAARALDMTHERVRRYARGLRVPGKQAMAKIVEWTNGEVTADDFYDLDTKKTDVTEAA